MKICKIQPPDLLFLVVLLAFTSVEIIFYKFLELHSTLSKKYFCHKFFYFNRFTNMKRVFTLMFNEMSALSLESIKHLTKSELKTELTKQGLPLNGRKDNLLKRLTETLNEESTKTDETEKHLQNISIEMIK